jgi:hypothetical protein
MRKASANPVAKLAQLELTGILVDFLAEVASGTL